ncbi:MAG: ADP-ribosylglycohydrolase family protein [Candidatus Aenigmarchaeota archaeon]|nr:ADP-ribosylglycohydrolase family protein [Candidatus Aenigmarchaeota archaeon]
MNEVIEMNEVIKVIEMNEILFNKIKGAIIGGALGDALGAPHEFYRDAKYNGKLYLPLKHKIRFQATKIGEIGQITDDTEMALIILRGRMESRTTREILMGYLKWANTPGTFSMGRNTRAVFKGIKTLKGYDNRRIKIIREEKSLMSVNEPIDHPCLENSQSNGALMRCHPYAIPVINGNDYLNLGIADCRLSNPNPTCEGCNEIYLFTIRYIYENPNDTKVEIIAAIEKKINKIDNNVVKDVVLNAIHNNDPTRDITKNKGWCIHGIWCVFYCLARFDDYKSAIDFIIEKSGDTDTNAAITGALLGAFYGFDAMSADKDIHENIEILLSCTTNRGELTRPKEYTMSEFNEFFGQLTNVMKM